LAGKRRVCTERAEGDGEFVFWYFVVVLLCPEGVSETVSGVHWWCVETGVMYLFMDEYFFRFFFSFGPKVIPKSEKRHRVPVRTHCGGMEGICTGC